MLLPFESNLFLFFQNIQLSEHILLGPTASLTSYMQKKSLGLRLESNYFRDNGVLEVKMTQQSKEERVSKQKALATISFKEIIFKM